MAAHTKQPALDTQTKRSRLEQRHAPYWIWLDAGVGLGYRKGLRAGTWIARQRDTATGERQQKVLGLADDAGSTADGERVLSYQQACAAVRAWARGERAAMPVASDQGEAPKAAGFTVADACRYYLQDMTAAGKRSRWFSEQTINVYILPALGARPVASLTKADIIEWHRDLALCGRRVRSAHGEAPHLVAIDPTDFEAMRKRRSTANRILTVLKAALNRAADGRPNDVPSTAAWAGVKRFKEAEARRERYLTREECVRLLNACQGGLRRLVKGGLLTALRFGDLQRMLVGDFNPDAKRVRAVLPKGGKTLHVPLDAEGMAFFTALVAGRDPAAPMFLADNGEPWKKNDYRRPLAQAFEVAAIDGACFYTLRHTWASHRAMAGMPLLAIAQVLGHKDTRMVELHYGHLAPNFVAGEVERTALGLGDDEATTVVPLHRSA